MKQEVEIDRRLPDVFFANAPVFLSFAPVL
jgi:hypothetical protein